MKKLLPVALVQLVFCVAGVSQVPDPARWQIRLEFHAVNAFGPGAPVPATAYSGCLQETDFPLEPGQRWKPCGERLEPTLAYSGVRNTPGLALDTLPREDPGRLPPDTGRFWLRTKQVVLSTLRARRNPAGDTLSVGGVGGPHGGAFLSNQWWPDRVNTIGPGLPQGTQQMGVVLRNFGAELWPDIRRKLRRRRE